MTEIRMDAEIKKSDMEAAYAFIGKRARRRQDPVEGISAALFSVILGVGQGMVSSGIPVDEFAKLLEQFKEQVVSQLKIERG